MNVSIQVMNNIYRLFSFKTVKLYGFYSNSGRLVFANNIKSRCEKYALCFVCLYSTHFPA